jgi:hypothetical protein
MSDETPKKRTRRPRPVTPEGQPPASPPAGGAVDPDDALRRLESMGTPGAAPPPSSGFEPLPPAPAVDSFGSPPPPRSQRPMGSAKKQSKARPRPAGSKTSRMAARIAVPIVFLVAVIALGGIVVNSGVMGGSGSATPTPTASSTKTSGSVTKKYVIKSGDSLSSIAVRFNTSTAELIQLNPDLDGSTTLVVGTRIVVPRQ